MFSGARQGVKGENPPASERVACHAAKLALMLSAYCLPSVVIFSRCPFVP